MPEIRVSLSPRSARLLHTPFPPPHRKPFLKLYRSHLKFVTHSLLYILETNYRGLKSLKSRFLVPEPEAINIKILGSIAIYGTRVNIVVTRS